MSNSSVTGFLKIMTVLPMLVDGPSKKLYYSETCSVSINEKDAVIKRAGATIY